jgi:hypothetical protein
MNDRQTVATLGGVLADLRQWQTRLAPENDVESATSADSASAGEGTELVISQAAYLKAEDELVSPARLRRFWPLFSLGAAAVFLPIAMGGIEALFLSHPQPRWLVDSGLAIALVAIFWMVGVKVFHPLIARAVSRSLDFHRHPERGRLTDAIRSFVASDRIQGQLERAAETAKRTLRKRVLAETQSALNDLVVLLEMRRNEIEWLNRQLGDYLSLEGVDTSKADPSFLPNRASNDVCRSVENNQDLPAASS